MKQGKLLKFGIGLVMSSSLLAINGVVAGSTESFWKLVAELPTIKPLDATSVAKFLQTNLPLQRDTRYFTFYKGVSPTADGDVIISSIDLRVSKGSSGSALLFLDIDRPCIRLNDIRAHYPGENPRVTPGSPHAAAPLMYYEYTQSWGALTFGLSPSRDCVATLEFQLGPATVRKKTPAPN